MVMAKGLNNQQATLSLTTFAGTRFADSKSWMSLQVSHDAQNAQSDRHQRATGY